LRDARVDEVGADTYSIGRLSSSSPSSESCLQHLQHLKIQQQAGITVATTATGPVSNSATTTLLSRPRRASASPPTSTRTCNQNYASCKVKPYRRPSLSLQQNTIKTPQRKQRQKVIILFSSNGAKLFTLDIRVVVERVILMSHHKVKTSNTFGVNQGHSL